MLIPVLQGVAPYLMGANSLLNGNPMGAVTSIAGGIMGNANAPIINGESLTDAFRNAARETYDPEGTMMGTGWNEYRNMLNGTYGGRRRF
jgi:hypothetical protein